MDDQIKIKTVLRIAGRANRMIADLRKLKKQAEDCGEPVESYDEEIANARNAKKTVEEWQSTLNETEWDVIFSRYMIGKAWKVIETELHLSHSRVMAIHQNALEKIEKGKIKDKAGQSKTKQDLQGKTKNGKVKARGTK